MASPSRRLANPEVGTSGDPAAAMTAVFNENVTKLNDLLFTYLDYAVIGVKL
jgi:hypothetical protein